MATRRLTIEFGGDDSGARKAIRSTGDEVDKLDGKLRGVGADAGAGLGRVGARAREVDEKLRGASRGAAVYGDGLDRAGAAGDEAESRFGGLASGIDGLTTVMANPSPQEFAQGLADLGDSASNFLIPSLKSAGGHLKNVTAQLGGAKGLLVGGGVVAGVGLLAAGLKQLDDQRAAERLEEINNQLAETGRLSDVTAERMLYVAAETGEYDRMLQQVADVGGPKAAERLVEQAELLGGNDDAMRSLNVALREQTAESDSLAVTWRGLVEPAEDVAEGVDRFSTAIDVLLGKQFGVEASQDQLAETFNATRERLAEQRLEFGTAGLALDGNSEAALRNREQLRGLTEDGLAVLQSMQEQGASSEALRAERDRQIWQLAGLRGEYGLNTGVVQTHIDTLAGIPLSRATTVNVWDQATGPLAWIRGRLDDIDGDVATATVRLKQDLSDLTFGWFKPPSFDIGGVVPGPVGAPTLALVHGGETIFPTHDRAAMAAMAGDYAADLDPAPVGGGGGGGGDTYVSVTVNGSLIHERDLDRVIAESVNRSLRTNGRVNIASSAVVKR